MNNWNSFQQHLARMADPLFYRRDARFLIIHSEMVCSYCYIFLFRFYEKKQKGEGESKDTPSHTRSSTFFARNKFEIIDK
jgi:hypothetical protein